MGRNGSPRTPSLETGFPKHLCFILASYAPFAKTSYSRLKLKLQLPRQIHVALLVELQEVLVVQVLWL